MRGRRRDDRVGRRRDGGDPDDRVGGLLLRDAMLRDRPRLRCAAICSCRAACAASICAISPLSDESSRWRSRDLRLDRLLRGRALRDEPLLGCALLREQLAVRFTAVWKCFTWPSTLRVERRDALRAVHARDHVVEALRAEDHLERRGLLRRVERDEALRDPRWLGVQVVLRDAAARDGSRARSRWIVASFA